MSSIHDAGADGADGVRGASWGGLRSATASVVLWVLLGLAFFYSAKERDVLKFGHDHWCSGHLMLMSKAYLNANFQTPYYMPMEDACGPVNGSWAPYTGWPPLFPILLALFQRVAGAEIGSARLLCCMLTAASAVLVLGIARRMTSGSWLAGIVAMGAFSLHPILVKYDDFVCFDTIGLTYGLALVSLYPRMIVRSGGISAAAHAALCFVGGLLAWQCHVVPLSCGIAWLLVDSAGARKAWKRLAAPIAAAVVSGIGVIKLYTILERTLTPNQWVERNQASGIIGKLLNRTGYDDPANALHRIFEAVVIQCRTAYAIVLPALALLLVLRLVEKRRPVPAAPVASFEAKFFGRALLLWPCLWTVGMAQMQLHEFQVIFAVPVLAVFVAFVLWLWRECAPEPLRSRTTVAMLLILSLACGLRLYVARGRKPPEPETHFATMAAEARQHSGPDTIIVSDFDNRGLWWLLDRKVVSRIRRPAVAGREYLWLRLDSNAEPTDGLELIARHEAAAGPTNDKAYSIWRSRPAASGVP